MTDPLAVRFRYKKFHPVPDQHSAQRLQENSLILRRLPRKIRHNAAISPVPALPPHVAAQRGGIPDRPALPVLQYQQSPAGPGQYVPPGQPSVRADAVGHVGDPLREAQGLGQLLRRDS